MATYNGAKYLEAQLKSLLLQSLQPWELVACDDGSSDDTVAVLEAFRSAAPFPVRVVRNAQRLGYARNFLKAAGLCTGDWVAFCDQDDWWLSDKLSTAAHAILDDPDLNLVLQNATLCDEFLNPSGRLFPALLAPGRYGRRSQNVFWIWHGFLQTVRRELFASIPVEPLPGGYPGEGVLSHDKWTCYVANALGGIAVLSGPSALYRRHPTALTGNQQRWTLRERLSASLATGSEQYACGAEVAAGIAVCIRDWGQRSTNQAYGSALMDAAQDFDKMHRLLAMRSRLHATQRARTRLSCLINLLASGAYMGPKVTSMGWKSAVKDATVAIGLFGRLNSLT